MARLTDAQWVPTVHTSGSISPSLILIHDTASRLTKGNVVNYLKKNSRKVSYHIVIERDGTVVQMADLEKRCHHAGRSQYKGRKWCNNFSIGIGMVNPGALKGTTAKAKSWYGVWFEDGLVKRDTPQHGRGHVWLEYTPEQIASLHRVVNEIKHDYPGIEIAGHYNVSPGRKIDPTPLLDLSSLGEAPPEPVETCKPAAQVLASNSREYKATDATKTVMGVGAVGGVAAEVGKAAGVENITFVKSYLDIVSGFISAYGVTMLVVGCVAGWGVMELIQHWKRESYDDGRYEPSGEVENEGSGDWL